jgi:predicted HicB family RNase H-like nuclease
MHPLKAQKSTKTFPLEIEDSLHKRLKVRAIEEDKTLHALIIDALTAQVQYPSSPYGATKKGGNKK